MAKKTKHVYKSTQKYNAERRPGESDLKYYRRLAKVADQRLVRLEELSKQKDFRRVKKFAYAKAEKDIRKYTKGSKRWNTKPPEDPRILQEKIMDMRSFIESVTSTKGGIIESYQKRADVLNQNYGTEFTWQDLADYFGKNQADRLAKLPGGSETKLQAVGVIQRTYDAIVKGIKTNQNITTDDPVVDVALEILNTRGKIASDSYTAEQKRQITERILAAQAERQQAQKKARRRR